jgi:hypothetical protein
LPVLLRISTLLSQTKMRCRPLRGVMVIKVSGNSPCWLISFASAAVPSTLRTGSRSTSTTHILLADPVGVAIIALGHLCHQARIWFSSVDAFLKPPLISGFLSSGSAGNTGIPCWL